MPTQGQQILIPADDVVCMAFDGAREDGIIFGVAECG